MNKNFLVGSFFALLLASFALRKSRTGNLNYTANEKFFVNTWDFDENEIYDYSEVENVQFQKNNGIQTINSKFIIPRIVPNSLTISAGTFKENHNAQPIVYVIPDTQTTAYDVDSLFNLHVNKDDGYIKFRFVLEIYSPETAIGALSVENFDIFNINCFYYGQDRNYIYSSPVFFEYAFGNTKEEYKTPMIEGSDKRRVFVTDYYKDTVKQIKDGKNYFLIEFNLPVFWRINNGVTRTRDKYRNKQDDFTIESLGAEEWNYQIGFENKSIPYREYLANLNFIGLYFQLGLKVEEGTYQKFNLTIIESNEANKTTYNPKNNDVTSTQATKYLSISDVVFPYNRQEFKDQNIYSGNVKNLVTKNYSI